MHTQIDEERSLKLLCDIQSELASALNSLGGKQSRGLLDNYNLHSAKHINRAVEGFVFLRKAGRVDGAKFLVRPVIETMFRIQAIQQKPELMYRIAYSETIVEDAKWLRAAAQKAGALFDEAAHLKRWEEFKKAYQTQFPNQTLADNYVSLWEIADVAGLAGYYDSHYRTYCRYTHAALWAIGDFLSGLTDPEDNRTMAFCAWTAINVIVSMGGASSKLQCLYGRLMDPESHNPNWNDITDKCQELTDKLLSEAEKLFGNRAKILPVRVTEFSSGPQIYVVNETAYIRLGPGVGLGSTEDQVRQLRHQIALEIAHLVLSLPDDAPVTAFEEGLTAYFAVKVGGYEPGNDPSQTKYKEAYHAVNELLKQCPNLITQLREPPRSIRGVSAAEIQKACPGCSENIINLLTSRW